MKFIPLESSHTATLFTNAHVWDGTWTPKSMYRAMGMESMNWPVLITPPTSVACDLKCLETMKAILLMQLNNTDDAN